jgi:hypothetical protein
MTIRELIREKRKIRYMKYIKYMSIAIQEGFAIACLLSIIFYDNENLLIFCTIMVISTFCKIIVKNILSKKEKLIKEYTNPFFN